MKNIIITSIIGVTLVAGAFVAGYQIGQENAEPPTIADVFEETSKQLAGDVEAEASDLTLELPTTGFDLPLEEFKAQAQDINFDDILRDGESYVGKLVKKQVKIQLTDEVKENPGLYHFVTFEMGVGDSYPPTWHLYYEPAEGEKEFLAGDTIEFTGIVMPLGDAYMRGNEESDDVIIHVRHIDMVEPRN